MIDEGALVLADGTVFEGELIGAPADIAAGETAWQEGRWEDASDAFARAYERTDDPRYLYLVSTPEGLVRWTPPALGKRAGRDHNRIDAGQFEVDRFSGAVGRSTGTRPSARRICR